VIQTVLLVSVLSCSAFGAGITVTPVPASQTWLEQPTNPLTQVEFAVQNNTATTLILDYALEIISGPPPDDAIHNTGAVSAYTYIPAGQIGYYIYGLFNPGGDPGDVPDPGLNFIRFQIELSPANTLPTSQIISTNPGDFGAFLFAVGGSSTATGPDATVLASLQAAFNNGGTFPANACAPLVNGSLFNGAGVVQGNACATVTVVDTPEPATLWGFGIGCAAVVLGSIRRGRNRRG
jgi:hypothetical protein